jgi:hypothetical protein
LRHRHLILRKECMLMIRRLRLVSALSLGILTAGAVASWGGEMLAMEGAGHGVKLSSELVGITLYDRIAEFFYGHLDLGGLTAAR